MIREPERDKMRKLKRMREGKQPNYTPGRERVYETSEFKHMTLMKTGKKNKGENTDKSNENSVWISFLLR